MRIHIRISSFSSAIHPIHLRKYWDIGSILEKEKKVLCLLVDNVDEHIRYRHARSNEEESKIFLRILRVICGLERTLHGRFCAVLALTNDIINTLHLADQKDPQNVIISLPQGDRNIRDRYRPVLNPEKGTQLLLFAEITKDDAAEMIENCMHAWKARHENENIWSQSIPRDCIYYSPDGKQRTIYPFTSEALEIIYEAAGHIPGEIVLGAISSIQQLYEIRKAYKKISKEPPEKINRSIAALGILQISRMKERAENSKIPLSSIMQEDPSVLFSYIIPQLARRLSLEEIDPRRNLGDAFIRFLELLGLTLGDTVPESGFGRTRGSVGPPEFPVFDTKFNFRDRKYGVIFLIPPGDDPSNSTRIDTGRGMLISGGAGTSFAGIHKEVDLLLIISIGKTVADAAIKRVENSFIVGNRDYRPCVAVIRVDEEWPWILKILHNKGKDLQQTGHRLSDETVRTQALLLENVDAYLWGRAAQEVKGRTAQEVKGDWLLQKTSWTDVLNDLNKKAPSYAESEPSRPDFFMPTG
jgi:hypothetical protein